MHEGGFFYQALVYLGAAVIAVPIAKRLGLGSVLGYLLAGVAIGPFVIGLVGEEGESVMHFAEFGVVMMLFLIGLELQPSLLWQLRVPILGIGGSQVVVTAVLISAVAMLLDLSWQMSLAIGLTLALSSTAIVMQSLSEKGLTKTQGGQNAFSVLLFQDIAVIPILAFLPLLAVATGAPDTAHGHDTHTWIDGLPVWAQTLSVFAIIAGIVAAGKYLIGPAFRIIAKTGMRELFTAAALLLVIGIAVVMTQVGLSPALGTFLAGVVLAQSEYRHELETDIEPFKGLLLGLFFIAVGASIDFELIAEQPGAIAQLVILLVTLKLLVLYGIGTLFKMKTDHNLLFTVALAQGGEFAFVLFSYATQNNVLTTDIAAPLIAVVALSMGLSPLLMVLYDKVIRPYFGTTEKSDREMDEIDSRNNVIIAGFGRMGSVIGRFLQANGIQATYLDINPDNVDFLRKMGYQVFYGDASRRDLLHAAGAEEARLIIIAVDDPEKGLKIAETAKKHFPHMEILARSNGWRDSYNYMDLGIEKVYRETFDTAIRMGSDALSQMGHRNYTVYRAAKRFIRRDQAFLKVFAETRKDDPNHFANVRRRFEELERMMLNERANAMRNKDVGWDNTSLIEEFKPIQEASADSADSNNRSRDG